MYRGLPVRFSGGGELLGSGRRSPNPSPPRWQVLPRPPILSCGLQSLVEKPFPAGETVFEQGDFPDRLFLTGEGEAEVVREMLDGETGEE